MERKIAAFSFHILDVIIRKYNIAYVEERIWQKYL